MFTQAPSDRSKLPLITTYQQDFIHRLDNLPPLPFCQEPCLYQHEGKLNPRCFPISLPVFPHRKRESAIPIAAGFETDIHASLYNEHKKRKDKNGNSSTNLSRCSSKGTNSSTNISPKETPENSFYEEGEYHHSVPTIVLKELVKLHNYTPSSDLREIVSAPKEKEAESKIPQVPFPNTSVRYRQHVKNANPENWQKIGCIWDKVQERNGFNSSKSNLESSTRTDSPRLLSRPRRNEQFSVVRKDNSAKPQYDKKNFNENIPGYGGYEPQLPIERCDNSDNVHSMKTTSKTYYRTHPRISYRLPKYGHNGPLSRLVTLTEPFNPFNKISNQRITVT